MLLLGSLRDWKTIQSWWGPITFGQWKDELLASIVVCFAQIPESVAFAALANVDPSLGLHAAWIIGLTCALFGGRPGMINGSAGALASVTCNFVGKDGSGVEELFCSVIAAGVLILVCAACNVGRFLALVPATVMVGFCNGLAIVIGRAQVSWFQDASGAWVQGEVLTCTIVHCCCAVLLMAFLPKLTRRMPASLLAIAIGCALEYSLFRGYFQIPTITIGEKSKFEQSRAVPRLFFLDDHYQLSNISNFKDIALQGVTLAIVAMLESLMTLEVMNDMTQTVGQPNRQIWALGFANTLAGLLGTMGGNSLIELSVMNVQAGGVLRASATCTALGVLAIVLFASPTLNLIPAGTLAGIMVIVVMDTAKWSSLPAMLASILPEDWLDHSQAEASTCFDRLRSWLRGLRIRRYDAFIIITVTLMTALTNLAIAVATGVFFASVRFAWDAQKPLEIEVRDPEPGQVRTYLVKGNLFFAAKDRLSTAFTPESDPPVVQIDFAQAIVFDFSVLHALHPILLKYTSLKTEVLILNMKDATHIHNLLRFAAVRDGGARSVRASVVDGSVVSLLGNDATGSCGIRACSNSSFEQLPLPAPA